MLNISLIHYTSRRGKLLETQTVYFKALNLILHLFASVMRINLNNYRQRRSS
jgi:hypothetical protein